MQNLFKFLLTGLVLVLVVTVGVEVAALRRKQPASLPVPPAVVVRKSAQPTKQPKVVRTVFVKPK